MNAKSQIGRCAGSRQRNSKATPRNTSASNMAISGAYSADITMRIRQRKRGHQAAAAEHQPGFVAIPHRRDGIHGGVAFPADPEHRKQDADAEIEAVHDHVHEHGEGENAGPDVGEHGAVSHGWPPSARPPAASAGPGVMPAACAGAFGGSDSCGCGACDMSLQQIPRAHAEHREIHDDEGDERGGHRGRRQRRSRTPRCASSRRR